MHRARRAPSSTTTRPAAPRAKAIQSLRLEQALGPGLDDGADRPPGDGVGHDVGRVGGGDDRPHPRPGGDLGRRSLVAMPPLPRAVPRPAGERLERGVDLDDLLDERRAGVERGDRR